jgi:hypothetical protein
MFAHAVRLTDVNRPNFGKANMVKFALGNELGHYAGALIEGNTMNDTCGFKQVEFLGPAELGEDKIDLAFKCCLPAAYI